MNTYQIILANLFFRHRIENNTITTFHDDTETEWGDLYNGLNGIFVHANRNLEIICFFVLF